MRVSKKIYLALLLLSCISVYFHAQNFLKSVYENEQELSELYTIRIYNSVNQVVIDTKILDEMFQLFGNDISEEQFLAVARIIFKPNYFSLISYQPQGVIKYIYPKKLYKWTLGIDILQEKATQIEALFAKTSGRTVLSGPYTLGAYEGLVARRPVYTMQQDKKIFWGFISVGFDVKKLLNDVVEIGALSTFKMHYAIDTIYKDKHIPVIKSDGFIEEKAHKRIFTVGDQTWVFYVHSADALENIFIVIFSFLSLYIFISTIIYILIKNFEEKHDKIKRLNYIDALTQAYNRKTIDEYFENYAEQIKHGFTLFYIDLNDFKPVNDTHGHEVGDKLLIAYVERVRHNFSSDTIVARMGGDEFVIIIHKHLPQVALESIVRRIEALSSEKFYLDGIKVKISASIGYVQCPQEGSTMSELLAKADERMYAWKKRVKEQRAAT